MKTYLNRTLTYLSCCLNCGCLWVDVGRLCTPCQVRLKGLETPCKSKLNSSRSSSFPVKTLYEWPVGESDLLSRLVLSLKGSCGKSAWQHYARIFVRKKFFDAPVKSRICIVPAPSRHPKIKDHAYLWAEALADALGAELVPCLRKMQNSSQRGADRGERALVELEVLENYTGKEDLSVRTLWIFADDIVTTGATARAAHQALGRPKLFEVWALAERRLACEASKDLL